MASISQILSTIRNQRLPMLCALCNQYHTNRRTLCELCIKLLVPLGPACQYCAINLPSSSGLICGACCSKKPDFDRVLTAYSFQDPLRILVHAFKYQASLYLTDFLTELMLDAITDHNYITECLIPIPMHPFRLRERGFNQAALLARHLSKRLDYPCKLYQCKKTINTLPQAGLNKAARQQNLKNSFQVKPLPYEHVTLVDDILTTGSTANELARLLKHQGVKRVDVWCCARRQKR